MRYRTQAIAYPYFVVAMLLFGLQMVFGLLLDRQVSGPDPIVTSCRSTSSKEIHTNLLIVWVLTGFMGATYWVVPEESRTEIYSAAAGLLAARPVDRSRGSLPWSATCSGWTEGNKLLEQPLPLKIVIVVVMLMFLYNIGMTIWKAKPLHHHRRRPGRGAALAAILYLPALLAFDNYTVSIYYRWWTVHLWVEGVWEMIQGGLPRLSPDPAVRRRPRGDGEVALRHRRAHLHRRHPRHRASLLLDRRAAATGCRSAASSARWSRWRFLGMAMYAYMAMRRSGLAHPNRLALHWTLGSAVFSASGPGCWAWRIPGRRQQVDPRHADHRHARPRGVLRRVRDDRARDDHLRAAGADRPRPRPGESPSATGRSGCRWPACSA